jgi:dTDP-4-dehydrorhamnose reductase
VSGCHVAIAGVGLIGGPLARSLRCDGVSVTTLSRRPVDDGPHVCADLATADGRRQFGDLLRADRPAWTVLVHGPGDVTWVEDNEGAARETHLGAVACATGHRLLLVSTDNVFDGTRSRRSVQARTGPPNAYGRVKLAAESAVLSGDASSVVARVSMVYGGAGSGYRATYAARCLAAASRNEALAAPVDQSFTPVHVDDVVEALSAVVRQGTRERVVHFSGPEELTRYEFACIAYEVAGADPALVRPVRRAATEWACRPRFSSLRSSSAAALGFAWRPRDPRAGLRRMVGTARLAGAG